MKDRVGDWAKSPIGVSIALVAVFTYSSVTGTGVQRSLRLCILVGAGLLGCQRVPEFWAFRSVVTSFALWVGAVYGIYQLSIGAKAFENPVVLSSLALGTVLVGTVDGEESS